MQLLCAWLGRACGRWAESQHSSMVYLCMCMMRAKGWSFLQGEPILQGLAPGMYEPFCWVRMMAARAFTCSPAVRGLLVDPGTKPVKTCFAIGLMAACLLPGFRVWGACRSTPAVKGLVGPGA